MSTVPEQPRCEVCRRPDARRDYGAPGGRGFLCVNCQLAVAHVEADHTRFRRVLGYLKRYGACGATKE